MKNWKRVLAGLLVSMMLATGCGEIAEDAAGAAAAVAEYELSKDAATEASTEDVADAATTEDAAAAESYTEAEEAAVADTIDEDADKSALQYLEPGPQVSTETIDEDGYYYDKDNVALYLVTYHKLPSNYITKKEANALGWEGGALEPYAHDMAIGGDHFGNYEGILPEDKEYHECDIDTKGKKRGAKRIIYSDDWDIYYTEDHYETFTLLYEGE